MKYKCLLSGTNFVIVKDGVECVMGFIVPVIIDADSPKGLEQSALREIEKTEVVANAVLRGEYGKRSQIEILGISGAKDNADSSMVFNWYPMT